MELCQRKHQRLGQTVLILPQRFEAGLKKCFLWLGKEAHNGAEALENIGFHSRTRRDNQTFLIGIPEWDTKNVRE